MNEKPLNVADKSYISSKRAAELFGYTSDYVGQLARKGKIESVMMGRDRFVDFESLKAYAESTSPNGRYPKPNEADLKTKSELETAAMPAVSKKGRKPAPKEIVVPVPAAPTPRFSEISVATTAKESTPALEDNFALAKEREVSHEVADEATQVEFTEPLSAGSGEVDIDKVFATRASEVSDIKEPKTFHAPFFAATAIGVIALLLVVTPYDITDVKNVIEDTVSVSNSDIDVYVRNHESAMVLESDAFDTLRNVGRDADDVYLGFLKDVDAYLVSLFGDAKSFARGLFYGEQTIVMTEPTTPDSSQHLAQDNLSQPAGDYMSAREMRDLIEQTVNQSVNDAFHANPDKRTGIVVDQSRGDVEDQIVIDQVKDSFSDEVEVNYDRSDGSGVIQPIFRSPSDDRYFFVIVPVDEAE